MAIQIIRNEAGNCVTFQGSSNPVYWNACLSGEVDSSDNTLINIKNDIRTISESEIVYEFFKIPYTTFKDADGSSFSNAQDCADYITAECNVLGSIGQQVASDTDEFNFFLDSKDNTIIISTGDYFPVNTIHAVLDSGTLSISSITGGKVYYSNINLDNISINGSLISGTDTEKINTLNALFQNTGSSTGEVPSITSSLSINLTQGDTLNYELITDYGVGYEWDLSNVSGITTVEGNPRKLIGGSSLSSGTYNIPVKAINYNGEDSQTVVLTVDAPAFSSTKSVKFQNLDYLNANASLANSSLGRTGNGSGSSDAWTISMWVKPIGTENNQTLFFYGGDDLNNEGSITLRYFGSSSLRAVRLEYGSDNNYLRLLAPSSSFPLNQWTHLIVAYDGGTTGSASGSVSSYYSRFKMYANGVLQTTSNSNRNSGWNGDIKDELMRVGRKGLATFYMRSDSRIDELAIWGSDESSNASGIYNSGNTHDLTLLTTS